MAQVFVVHYTYKVHKNACCVLRAQSSYNTVYVGCV